MWLPRPRRRLRTYATAFLLGAAVLLVAGWSALPVLVERRLLEEVRAAGIAVASLNVTAVGLTETRIENVRLGPDGEVTVAAIVASYDLRHFLRAQPERLAVRDLHVSAKLGSNGLALGIPERGGGNRGGLVLDGAILRAMPTITIEGGRIELATPIGPLAAPFKGVVAPRSDGGVEATIDLQAESAHGRFGGALKLVVTDRSLDADLMIADGAAAIGRTLSTAFAGRMKATWVQQERPRVWAALDLKGASIGGSAFPAGSLAIEMADAQWTAQLALVERDGSSDLRTRLVVSSPYENPRLSVAGNLTAAPGAWLWPLLGLPQPQRGSARVALWLDGPLPDGGLLDRSIGMPGDVIGLLADGDVNGRADITIRDVVLPNRATIDSATGGLDIHASGGTISIEQASELRASGTIDPARLRSLDLASDLSTLLSGQLNANVALPQPLRLVARDGIVTAVGDVRVSLASASGAILDLQTKGRAVLSNGLAISEFTAGDCSAVLSGIALPFARSARLEIAGSITGNPDRFDGRWHAVGTLSDLTMAGLRVAGLDVNLDTAIAGTVDRIAVRLAGDGGVIVRGVSGAALAGPIREIAVPIVQGEEPLITIDPSGRAAYDLRLGAIKTNAPLLLGGPKPFPVTLALPGLRWMGSWSVAEHEGKVQLADGSLAFPSLDVRANGVHAAVAITGNEWSADLGVARVLHSAKPPLVAPLSLTGKAAMIGHRLSFAGILSDSAKRLKSTIEIEHTFATNKGQAKLKMADLIFRIGGLQPRDLLPAVSPQIEDVTGNAAIGGTIAWSGGKVASDIKLLLQDVSFKSPQVEVIRLNSVVTISSLVPFGTRPAQQLAAGMVDVGLPLADLVAAFRIDPGPQLVIESARLSLTGGEVTMPTVAIDLADPRAQVTLNVKDVDLAGLLQLAQIEGLAGTGTLTGRIPVSIAGDAVVIHGATLAATGPGSLRYAPATTPSALVGGGANVDMALQALSNFQYSDLTLTMNREAGGDTVALMHVKGRNPDFYGGYPVELNLNISGKLDQILDRGLTGYRIPESIRRSLGDFGQ
jgi:hypothetical protein